MKRYFVGIIVFFVLTTIIAILAVPRGNIANLTVNLTQEKIEATALIYAQQMALQGTPTSTASKKMSVADFRLLLDPFSKGDPGTDEVWLVLFKGNVVVSHPSQYTTTSQTTTDSMWVDLTPEGQVLGGVHFQKVAALISNEFNIFEGEDKSGL